MSAAEVSASESLEARYASVCDRVGAAARRAGRSASDVILVAVTKAAEPDQIRALLQLGHRDFGENRAQQLVQRASMVDELLSRQRLLPSARKLTDPDQQTLFGAGADIKLPPVAGSSSGGGGVRWHMIGHLQRNKARKVADFVRLIHSVDSLRLAEELQQLSLRRDHVIEVLLQINCSGEESKFGCPVPAAIPMAEQLESMINVRLRGVMTMAAPGEKPGDARGAFQRCREIFEEIKRSGVTDPARFNILSMGMSDDFEVAIAEGANIVRVGSAIFGRSEKAEEAEAEEAE